MRIEWLRQTGGSSLIVFFNGWGMDAAPLRPLTARDHDVVVCSEYSPGLMGEKKVEKMTAGYARCLLIGWSMGVYFGNICFQKQPSLFHRRIAVNGTLNPVHDAHGIPVQTFQATLANLDAKNLEKFYRRMFRPGGDFALFARNRPQRSLESQHSELAYIADSVKAKKAEESIYTDVVITGEDRVVPTGNQHLFWRPRAVKTLRGPHFPFYGWQSWEALVAGLSS